jgi:biotin-(acetyl-CoA carboxylase) ligase
MHDLRRHQLRAPSHLSDAATILAASSRQSAGRAREGHTWSAMPASMTTSAPGFLRGPG